MLLDAEVEGVVVGVRLDAERPVARDVADVRARVPVRGLGRLCSRVPGRPGALDAAALLGIGQEVEEDVAGDGLGGVGGVFGGVGGVADWPAGWVGERGWWALFGEGGGWWAVFLDVVHDCVSLAAL